MKYKACTLAQVPSSLWTCSLACLPGSSELDGSLIPKCRSKTHRAGTWQLLLEWLSVAILLCDSAWFTSMFTGIKGDENQDETHLPMCSSLWPQKPYGCLLWAQSQMQRPVCLSQPPVTQLFLHPGCYYKGHDCTLHTGSLVPTPPCCRRERQVFHCQFSLMLRKRKASPSLPILPQASWSTRHDEVGSHASDVIISF